MRKPAFCICENKDADQLRGNRVADQRLCFATRIVQSLFYLNPKFQAHTITVTVQPGLCRTWSETLKTGFLRTRLNYLLKEICCRAKVILPSLS